MAWECEATLTICVPHPRYVEDLRNTLNEGSIMQRKAFLNSFIRRINIKDSMAEIEYTCPIGLNGNLRNEVLSMARIGSRGRARS